MGGEQATRYGLALHRPGKTGGRRDDVDRTRGGGDRRQTVAESGTSIEDVLKGIIGQPTDKAKVVVETRGTKVSKAECTLAEDGLCETVDGDGGAYKETRIFVRGTL